MLSLHHPGLREQSVSPIQALVSLLSGLPPSQRGMWQKGQTQVGFNRGASPRLPRGVEGALLLRDGTWVREPPARGGSMSQGLKLASAFPRLLRGRALHLAHSFISFKSHSDVTLSGELQTPLFKKSVSIPLTPPILLSCSFPSTLSGSLKPDMSLSVPTPSLRDCQLQEGIKICTFSLLMEPKHLE